MKPQIIVILAMSADGKIADYDFNPARFSSRTDLVHLQRQISAVDAVLFGAGTLRVYGTTMTVSLPELLQERHEWGKSGQPIQIVCSPSGVFNREMRFFSQPVPRWLITTDSGAKLWENSSCFDHIITTEVGEHGINWVNILTDLLLLGINKLAVIGGGQLVASFMEQNLIDELCLTICPIILGGKNAPTPVEGRGFLGEFAPKLQLLSIKNVGEEVFLHYRVLG